MREKQEEKKNREKKEAQRSLKRETNGEKKMVKGTMALPSFIQQRILFVSPSLY